MFHYSQIGDKRGECVISNFWLHIGDRLYDGRLSCVRKPHESDIGDELEFEFYLTLFSSISEFCEVRSLTSTGREMSISIASSSSMTESEFLTRMEEVHDDASIFYIRYDGSDRDLEYCIFCCSSVHFLGSSTFTFSCFYDFRMTIAYECRLMGSSA